MMTNRLAVKVNYILDAQINGVLQNLGLNNFDFLNGENCVWRIFWGKSRHGFSSLISICKLYATNQIWLIKIIFFCFTLLDCTQKPVDFFFSRK